jgi:hypothetical protein
MFMFTLHGNSLHILLGEDDFTIGYLAFCRDTLLAHGGKHIESALRYQTLLDAYTTGTSEKIKVFGLENLGPRGASFNTTGKEESSSMWKRIDYCSVAAVLASEPCNLVCPVQALW